MADSKADGYKCTKCNVKPFTQKSHLNSHMRLKHDEIGKRMCVKCECTNSYAQINNFVVHFKKEHLNKNCKHCDEERLCKICDLDLSEAKVKWQLQPLEINSPEYEVISEHNCHICEISFTQKSHLISHNKLKHDVSKKKQMHTVQYRIFPNEQFCCAF